MDEHDKLIIQEICQHRAYNKSFEEIITRLEDKFNEFNPINNSFLIETYFGEGKREGQAKTLLLSDGIIGKDWLKKSYTKGGNLKIDFKGVYIFIHKSTPFYVGISRKVIGRICQHVKGHTHNSASLAYKIALITYEHRNGKPYTGVRKDLDFKEYVAPVQQFLLKQKLAFLPIENDEELFLFELFCSMKLGTWLNDFETH